MKITYPYIAQCLIYGGVLYVSRVNKGTCCSVDCPQSSSLFALSQYCHWLDALLRWTSAHRATVQWQLKLPSSTKIKTLHCPDFAPEQLCWCLGAPYLRNPACRRISRPWSSAGPVDPAGTVSRWQRCRTNRPAHTDSKLYRAEGLQKLFTMEG